MKLLINSRSSLGNAIGQLQKLFEEKRYVIATLKTGRDRTLDQNRLWFGMYKRIADTLGWSISEARSHCKLMIGVSMLYEEDEQFREHYDRLFSHLDHEEQLALMVSNPSFGPDGYPVTRLFTRKQGAQYTEAIAAEFGQHGVFFDDMLDEVAA